MAVTAVLDIGKTNLKLALFEGAAELWQTTSPNRALPGPPYPHADVAAIERFALNALQQAQARFPISTIVVTTHGATAALVDEAGALALPVLDYEHAAVDEIAQDYIAVRPPFTETFTAPVGAGLVIGRQLLWQERNFPKDFARARHLLAYPQYIAFRLTGVLASELTSLGCHTDLWNPIESHPSSLAKARGWDRLLPPVRRAWDVLGPIRPSIAAATGLPPSTQVLTGIHDSNASILPHLATLTPPFTVISTGTWIVVMAVGGDTALLDPKRDMLANVDAAGRPLPTAKAMGGREVAVLLNGAVPACDMSDLAGVLRSGAMALPSFLPSGGPFEGRTGEVIGSVPPGERSLAALASLYAALVTDTQLTLLGAKTGPLLVEGSFAANTVYGCVLGALRPDQPVMLSSGTSGTAYGASLLASWPAVPPPAPMARAEAFPEAALLKTHAAEWTKRAHAP